MSDKRHTVAHPNGTVIVCCPEGIFEADTVQCVHCGGHWEAKVGSGKLRGYCGKCKGPLCGPRCAKKCVPMEQMLENMEAYRDVDFTPITTSVLWTPR